MTSPVEHLAVPGLAAPAEIIVDRWGIPHIRAGSEADLFFVQGFNAARDRLWQIDLWRKRGLGLLAADFGPGFLAQDHASRLFLYRGDMAAEWAAYGAGAREACTAFVAGINAYVAQVEAEPGRLPPEFGLAGTRPARWEAEDVVRIRSHGLTRNALSEVLRAHVLARSDAATDALRKLVDPPVEAVAAPGIDLAAIPLAVLTVFKLATAGVTLSPERLACPPDEAWRWTTVTDLGEVLREQEMTGSNNWVVDGAHTETGRPILANDPHRAHSVPSLRYLVHLTAPGLDVIGAGEPVIPGISLGHNGTAAFGLTIFYSDQEDVYVYETDSEDPRSYRYGDGFEAMRRVDERFVVRGTDDVELPLWFTRHGPVLLDQPEENRAYAVRSVWFEPGSSAYLRSLDSMRQTSLPAFQASMRGWGVPSSNHVYADTSGTIAWVPAGWTPVRANWTGLLPVPGDGRFEWAGMLDMDLLPRVVDPPAGFIATANEMNLPEGYPHAVGHEWVDRSRISRIDEVLASGGPHSVAAACALQTDTLSVPARRMGRLVDALPETAATRLLVGWNHHLGAESGPAALFEVWWSQHLKPALFARLVPDPAVRALMVPGDVDAILAVLEAPDARFGADPAQDRDALLATTLAAAFADCAARLGPDTTGWAWGRLHHAAFEHPLAGFAVAGFAGAGFAGAGFAGAGTAPLNVGPFPHGGSGQTPMHTGYRPADFRTIAGASVRLVIDVGNWDASRAINAPGQSGDPRSPHYRDLAPLWAAGEYVPLSYSRDAVDAAAVLRIVLTPA